MHLQQVLAWNLVGWPSCQGLPSPFLSVPGRIPMKTNSHPQGLSADFFDIRNKSRTGRVIYFLSAISRITVYTSSQAHKRRQQQKKNIKHQSRQFKIMPIPYFAIQSGCIHPHPHPTHPHLIFQGLLLGLWFQGF